MQALMVIGTVVSAYGTIAAGSAQRAEADSQAYQMRQQAGQERASAQRAEIVQRRQGAFALSRAQAVAAAGGGDTTDPTVVNVEKDIAGQTEYNAMTALFNGEERARGLETGANFKNFEGDQAYQKGLYSAAGTIFKGGSSWASKYGDTSLPWQAPGNVRPEWMGGGYYGSTSYG